MRLSSTLAIISVAVAALASPAAAQSAAEHHAAMIDIAATPPWGSDEGSYEDDAPHQYLSREELEAIGERLKQDQAIEQAEHERRLRDDPAYRMFHEGYWLPMPADAVAKGGPCTIHFSRKGQGVLLMGPTRDYPGAFLSFYGYAVPAAKKVRKMQLVLRQAGDPPQTVQVFNSVTPWGDRMGMVFFAVPTIDAAMAGMTDDLDFTLEKDGEMLMSIKWHGGRAEREKLKSCLAGQRSAAK